MGETNPTPVPLPPPPAPTPVKVAVTWQEVVRVIVYAVLMYLGARFGMPAPVVNVTASDNQPAPIVTVQPR